MSNDYTNNAFQTIPEEKKLKLVPSRWSHTGWKYVLDDPKSTKFFTNPNRANCHGWKYEEMSFEQKLRNRQNRLNLSLDGLKYKNYDQKKK